MFTKTIFNIFLQTRPHGYEPPSLVKRPSDRGKLLTQSSTRRSLEHVDDIPAPPLCRKALSNIGKPKDSLTSRDTGDCNENSSSSSQSTVTVAHKNSSTKTSSEQKGSKLSPKDSSKSIDLLRAESVDSPPSLYDKRMKAGTRSREKSDTEKSRRSSMTDHKKSSSSKSKSAIVASNNNSSTKSLGPTSSATPRQLSDRTVATDNSACRSLGTKSSISRRHSVTFATSPGTNCEMNIKRHDSAPLPSRFTKMKHESQKAILNLLNEGTPKGSKPELTNDTKHHRRNISKRN